MKNIWGLLTIFCVCFTQLPIARADLFNHPYVRWFQDDVSWENKHYRQLRRPTPEESARHYRDFENFREQWSQIAKGYQDRIIEIRSQYDCGSVRPQKGNIPLSPSQQMAYSACAEAAQLKDKFEQYHSMAEAYRPLQAVEIDQVMRDTLHPYNDTRKYYRMTGKVFDQQERDAAMASNGSFRSYEAFSRFHNDNRAREYQPIQARNSASNNNGASHTAQKPSWLGKSLKNAFRKTEK